MIELIGTPGAGKTTLGTALVEDLRARGIDAVTVVGGARRHAARTRIGGLLQSVLPTRLARRLLWVVFYLAGLAQAVALWRTSPLLQHVVRAQRARPIRRALRRHIIFWFLQLGGRHRFLTATASPGEVLVYDDGFLHRAIHLHASCAGPLDADAVARYVELLPQPTLAVHVRAGLGTCTPRVRARGVWAHSSRLTGDELARYLAQAEHVAEVAVRRARQRGWDVLEIDTPDGDLERRRRELVERVAAHLQRVQPAAASHREDRK